MACEPLEGRGTDHRIPLSSPNKQWPSIALAVVITPLSLVFITAIPLLHLASEVVAQKNISGGKVSVDKVFPCQVAHSGGYVFAELEELFWDIFTYILLCYSEGEKEGRVREEGGGRREEGGERREEGGGRREGGRKE